MLGYPNVKFVLIRVKVTHLDVVISSCNVRIRLNRGDHGFRLDDGRGSGVVRHYLWVIVVNHWGSLSRFDVEQPLFCRPMRAACLCCIVVDYRQHFKPTIGGDRRDCHRLARRR